MKLQVYQKLAEGLEPKVIANLLDISQAKVLRHKREFEDARLAGTLNQLIDLDAERLEEIQQTLIERSPTEFTQQIEGTFDKLKTLDTLNVELQDTARTINARLKALSSVAVDATELSIIVDSLCAMQTAFFNRNQVNIQNNFGDSNGDRKYSNFLSDVPKLPKDN